MAFLHFVYNLLYVYLKHARKCTSAIYTHRSNVGCYMYVHIEIKLYLQQLAGYSIYQYKHNNFQCVFSHKQQTFE
jgi:hypothetical protein